MAKIYLQPATTQFVVSNGASLYGAQNNQAVSIAAGVTGVVFDQNTESVSLVGKMSDYLFAQAGNTMQVYSGTTLVAKIPTQGDDNGTLIQFSDVCVSAKLTGSSMSIGGVAVGTTSTAIVATSFTTLPVMTTVNSAAGVYLDSTDTQFTVSNSANFIYGGSGTQAITVATGVTLAKFDQNIESVSFVNSLSDYRFAQAGNGVLVYSGSNLVSTIPTQGDTDGTMLTFANGSVFAKLTNSVMSIGDKAISDIPATVSPTNINTSIFSGTGVLSGKVVDGYVAGATVFIDANGNGKLDNGEVSTFTDASGNYSLPAGSGSVTAMGGTDLLTGKPFQGVMTAPAGSTSISPLTTLVQSAISSGKTVDQAKASVATALGLPAGVDVSTYDPIAALTTSATDATALAVQKAAQQVMGIMTQATVAIDAADNTKTTAQIAAEVSQAITTAIANNTSGGALDLTNATMITGVISQAATATGTQSVVNNAAAIASVTASSNTQINNATTLSDLAKAAVVSQVNAVNTLKDAVTNNTVDSATSTFNSTITTQIHDATTGTTPAPTTQTINVTATGTTDASTLASTFNFTVGSDYAYTITGFNDGDVLNFPDTNKATIINRDLADGKVDVQWALDGNTVVVHLTGIPTADDGNIYGVTSFNTAFGAGSLI